MVFITVGNQNIIESSNLNRLAEGALNIFEFKVAEKYNDDTFSLRLAIWKAGYYAFWEAPLFGYGPTERFNAVVPYLSIEWLAFSHPHNDILASALSVGYLGIPFGLTCILSPIWATLLIKNARKDRLFLGLSLSVSFFTMANVNTVLFNDITSAWLAFCTFLIWNLKR